MENVDYSLIAIQYLCLLFSLSVHEASHAAMAERCGDQTARLLGRVTLNPIKHIDPIGTVIMPMLMMVFQVPFLIGWAKPVPFNLSNLRNPRRDSMWIALAGPLSNLAIAIVGIIALRAVFMTGLPANPGLELALVVFPFLLIMLNVLLALFNMIPVPPLDGHHVLKYFLPRSGQDFIDAIGPFGILIAIVIASRVIAPAMAHVARGVQILAGMG